MQAYAETLGTDAGCVRAGSVMCTAPATGAGRMYNRIRGSGLRPAAARRRSGKGE